MQERKGCAMTMVLLVGCALIWFLVAYGVFKLGSMAIEAMIPDADAVEVAAPTTTGTTTGTTTYTKVVVPTTVDEKVARAGAKVARAGAKVARAGAKLAQADAKLAQADAKLAQADANVEGTVEIPAEPTPELPRPTIGEVDAEAEENRLIEEALLARAHKIEDCLITYYCCEKYPHICGTGDGLTALGGEVLPGVSCAVPPGIPLGSTIMIDWGDGEIEYRRADDRGGWVKGNHIDLAVSTHTEALGLGVDYATVYWVEEEVT